jgi:hypothetical protein
MTATSRALGNARARIKSAGVGMMAVGLLIAIVPQFAQCHPEMICVWTARAAIGAGALLVATGGVLLLPAARGREAAVGASAMAAGVLTVLLPYVVPTCADPTMICNTVMKPVLVLSGGAATALGGVVIALSRRLRDRTH